MGLERNNTTQRILFITSNPATSSHLPHIEDEIKSVKEQLCQKATLRGNFQIIEQRGADIDSIFDAMLRHKPRIVHFSGHGLSKGGIVIHDDENLGRSFSVTDQGFARLFQKFSDNIDCVILNACYSESQAEAIARYIPYVVGMTDSIKDKLSMNFSKGFYKALGEGQTIEESFDLAQIYLATRGLDDSSVALKKRLAHDSHHMDELEVRAGVVHHKLHQKRNQIHSQDIDLSTLRDVLRNGDFEQADEITAELMLKIAQIHNASEAISQSGSASSDTLGNLWEGATHAWRGIVASTTNPLDKLNYEDLNKIDGLWVKYSKNKFGFSIQKRIFFECGAQLDGKYPGDLIWSKFGEKVGWQRRSKWKKIKN